MCKMKLIPAIVVFTVLSISILAQAEYYYVVTYGADKANHEDRNIYLKMIDLESAKVKDKIWLTKGGIVVDGQPVQLEVTGGRYLFIVVWDGIADRNATQGKMQHYYKIVKADSNLTLVKSGTFDDCTTGWPRQYPGENYFEFGMVKKGKHQFKLDIGNYTIDKNYNFVSIGVYDPEYWHGIIKEFKTYGQLNPLNLPNKHNLYFCWDSRQILRLNSLQDSIIDSFPIKINPNSNYLYAYHPMADKFYLFYLNYVAFRDISRMDKTYGKDWIMPEVFVYDADSFKLIAQDTITDFTCGNYPGPENGRADVAGNYIVKYFFEPDSQESFDPAMLFIFDTRTNTARWLNVGWR